ncbi:hypothetical protein N0V90_009946 [Kalmusia sp. IMI 367209]|nr:hypothetical protein N0V90_009946 [Kalmusia sp. IMI 367209]
MDSQSFDAWWSQGNYPLPPHQTTIFELPPDLSKVPSLSGSPFPGAIPQEYYPQIVSEAMQFGSYQIPMTPPEFGSDHDSPYCSPRPPPHVEPRRRAQNRAAQRAFRERKEKHARDLEAQLAALTDKYNKLETSHSELSAAYEKLQKTIELLTQDDAEGEDDEGKQSRRRSSNSETLRKLLEIIHGDYKGVPVKNESP